jgi:hypothetical protein
MSEGDLDVSLLHQIMLALGEWRNRRPYRPMQVQDLKRKQALPPSGRGFDGLVLHLDFLAKSGLVKQSAADPLYRTFELSAKGCIYVQPELAEFGKPSMLPEVVKSIEDKIQILSYPQEEKDGMIYRLREAVSKQVPGFLAEVLVKTVATMVTGHGVS